MLIKVGKSSKNKTATAQPKSAGYTKPTPYLLCGYVLNISTLIRYQFTKFHSVDSEKKDFIMTPVDISLLFIFQISSFRFLLKWNFLRKIHKILSVNGKIHTGSTSIFSLFGLSLKCWILQFCMSVQLDESYSPLIDTPSFSKIRNGVQMKSIQSFMLPDLLA